MLQAIRSKAGSLVVKILFALLIVSFGVWGIGDIFRERSAAETTVASVGDVKIQADELQLAVRREMDRMNRMLGGNFTAEQAKQIGLTDMTIVYSRPGVKGRQVWGTLVPYDKVWRTGANEATTFVVSDDVKINGQLLPKGMYSLTLEASEVSDPAAPPSSATATLMIN